MNSPFHKFTSRHQQRLPRFDFIVIVIDFKWLLYNVYTILKNIAQIPPWFSYIDKLRGNEVSGVRDVIYEKVLFSFPLGFHTRLGYECLDDFVELQMSGSRKISETSIVNLTCCLSESVSPIKVERSFSTWLYFSKPVSIASHRRSFCWSITAASSDQYSSSRLLSRSAVLRRRLVDFRFSLLKILWRKKYL